MKLKNKKPLVYNNQKNQIIEIKNILIQILTLSRFKIIFGKILRRFFDIKSKISRTENKRWLVKNCANFEAYAKKRNPFLWNESKKYAATLKKASNIAFKNIPYDLGGGGYYPLLYFLTRLKKPRVIVETGVAAGYSSSAFLAAIKRNRFGRLYSSDFPYFRLKDPEKFIGLIVKKNLKNNWELFIEGDEINIPKILKKVSIIDFFHYDSDKSYFRRKKVFCLIKKYLARDSIAVMDDIQDNSFFFDLIKSEKPKNWRVFKFEGKYIGLIGTLN